MNSYLVVSVVVVASVLLSVGGLLLMRKFVPLDRLKESHEVSGYLLAVVGTLYAVLLGLIVVDAMQQFQAARDVTQAETNNLVDVFFMANQLHEPKRSEVRKLCTNYADRVVSVEWQQMNEGSYCPVARGMAMSLMQAMMNFEPKTENEKALYPQMVQEASQLWQHRQQRISRADRGVPMIEWVTLIVGAVLTVFFTFFFVLDHVQLQVIMTAMVAMLISLNLSLLFLFAYPFSGDLSVQADSFKLLQDIFKEGSAAQPTK